MKECKKAVPVDNDVIELDIWVGVEHKKALYDTKTRVITLLEDEGKK